MKHYLTMILASICLGFIGIFTKLTAGTIPILTLFFLRFVLATLGIYIILQFTNYCTLCNWKDQFKHNIWGGLLIAISFSSYVAANTLGPVTNAVILLYLNPLFVMILAWLILKEVPTRFQVIAFIGAFIGLIFINPLQTGNLFANLLAILAAVTYGAYIVYMRGNSLKHSLSFLFWAFFIASIILFPISIVELIIKGVSFNVKQLWVLPLGLVSTATAYTLFSYSLEKIPAETGASISMSITPLVAIIAAIFLFSENPTLKTILGGVLLIGSFVYLEQKTLAKKK